MNVQLSLAKQLAQLTAKEQQEILEQLSESDLEALEHEWRFWARPDQIAPEGDWSTWLALAGRGWGKTEAGAQWVNERVDAGAKSIALIAETQKDLEEVMVQRLIKVAKPGNEPIVRFRPVRVVWPSGAIALGYNGTEPDQLRGPEFDTAWVDELAKYKRARDTWDMLQFTMRSGKDPRVFVTTTPRNIPVIREMASDPTTVVTKGSTFDNADNLPKVFLDRLTTKYAGTRLGRQELEAEILDDLVGALWQRENFDENRVDELPDMQRVVVAVDPSGSSGDMEDNADDIGIVVAGKGVDGRGYILEDISCNLSPDGWGKVAVKAYKRWKADRIVAERNFGGAMVEHVIKTVDNSVSYRGVVASRGKVIRAEPVAALYEQDRVSHLGEFKELEDQMCMMGPDGYAGEGSPDRLDAAVWALSDLMITGSNYTLDNL